MTAELCTVSGSAHDRHHIRDGQNGLLCSRPKAGPSSHVVFRPEEMDTASCVRPIFRPLSKGYICIPTNTSWGFTLNGTVFDNNMHPLAAIQTRRINLHRFSEKTPADRQGFYPSLPEPFLLSISGDAARAGTPWCSFIMHA